MSIKRSERRQTFTVIDNDIINDDRIPADSAFLLVYLLSKPDSWQVNASHLMTRFNYGTNKIYRMLSDLRDLGYATYTKHFNGETDWIISEHRIGTPYGENPDVANPDLDNGDVLVKTERAVNTDIKPFDRTAFERWWKLYPKKVGKKASLAVWKRIKPDPDLLIEDTKNRVKNCSKWKEGFIKDPERYLKHEQWTDEIGKSQVVSKGPEIFSQSFKPWDPKHDPEISLDPVDPYADMKEIGYE